jgi:hypothetical protein
MAGRYPNSVRVLRIGVPHKRSAFPAAWELCSFFHRDGYVGAHGRAKSAADAFFQTGAMGGMVALLINMRAIQFHDLLGASVHA